MATECNDNCKKSAKFPKIRMFLGFGEKEVMLNRFILARYATGLPFSCRLDLLSLIIS